MHIVRCMGSKFSMKFQREPLKFHTKFWIHTLHKIHFTDFYFCMWFMISLNSDVITPDLPPWSPIIKSGHCISPEDRVPVHFIWHHIWVHCRDLTGMVGRQDSSPSNGHQVTCCISIINSRTPVVLWESSCLNTTWHLWLVHYTKLRFSLVHSHSTTAFFQHTFMIEPNCFTVHFGSSYHSVALAKYPWVAAKRCMADSRFAPSQ